MFDLSALKRQQKSVLLIAGATATGKSRFALECLEQSKSVIINADSMQIYNAIPILTAQPSQEERARAPHRLYGTLEANDICSVARWCEVAKAEIQAAWAEQALPIVVGGTGLYLRTLLEGISPIPDIDEKVRKQVRDMAEHRGARAVQKALYQLDPASAERLSDNDTQRLCRALEVALSTGTTLTDWHDVAPVGGLVDDPDIHCKRVVLHDDRETVYARCDARLASMLGAGALDELKALSALGLDNRYPVMRAVGVPPLLAYLSGQSSKSEALELAKRDTRRFAKRQMTWLRNQFGKWNWIKV